jgi:peroxiredoxin
VDLGFDVVELADSDYPREGEQAPDFRRPLVTDEFWEDRALSALTAEDPVLLVFHPMDGAFPATYMWNELRDREVGDYGVRVVGCSISDPYAHKDLIEEREIDFALFSDPGNGVAEAYDIANDLDGMTGIAEPRPAVFVIDEERVVQYAWVAAEWPDFPDYDDLEAALAEV